MKEPPVNFVAFVFVKRSFLLNRGKENAFNDRSNQAPIRFSFLRAFPSFSDSFSKTVVIMLYQELEVDRLFFVQTCQLIKLIENDSIHCGRSHLSLIL